MATNLLTYSLSSSGILAKSRELQSLFGLSGSSPIQPHAPGLSLYSGLARIFLLKYSPKDSDDLISCNSETDTGYCAGFPL